MTDAADRRQAAPAVRLRPFDPETDLPRLRRWLNRPHVARWWGDPERALEEARHRPPEAHVVIIADERPAGYMCWATPSQHEREAAGLTDLPADLLDVDVLLGEPEALGKGIGPHAGALLLAHLHATCDASCVGVGTSASNQRALRAAEKLGFRLVRTFDDPEIGPCCYMVLDMRDSHSTS